MVKALPTKTSFAYGEVSPGLLVDPESEEYVGGCEAFRNAMATRTGGFRLRYGGDQATMFSEFFPSMRYFAYQADGQSFFVFVGARDSGPAFSYLGIFTTAWAPVAWVPTSGSIGPLLPGDGVFYVAHSYTEAQVRQLRGRQTGRRFYLNHESHPPIYFERRSDGKFAVGDPPIDGGSPQVRCYRDANFLSGAGIIAGTEQTIDATLDTFSRQDALGTQPAGSRTPGMVLRFGTFANSETLNPHYGSWYHGLAYINSKRMRVDKGANATQAMTPGYQFAADDWCGPWVSTGVTKPITVVTGHEPNHTAHQVTVFTDAGSNWTVEDRHKVFYFDQGVGVGGFAYWLIVDVVPGSPTQIHARVVYDSYNGEVLSSGSKNVTVLEVPSRLMAGAPAILSLSAQPPRGSVLLIRSNRKVFTADHVTAFGYVSTAEGNPSSIGTGTPVGTAVFLNGGIARLDQYIDEYTVRGRVVKPFNHIGPTVRWGMGWNKKDGFPSCSGGHQGRTLFAGFKGQSERTICGSRPLVPDDHTIGVQSNDAFNLEIEEVHGGRIAWMESSGSDLLVGTTHAVKAARGVLTPTSFGFDHQSDHGSAVDCESTQISTAALFVTSDGLGIRTATFEEASQRYQSFDLTETAKHLFTSRIVEIHVVENPEQILCARLAGGELIVCCLRQGVRNVRAWSKWTFATPLSGCSALAVIRAAFSSSGTDELHAGIAAVGNRTVVQRMMQSAQAMDSAVTPTGVTATQLTLDVSAHAHLLQVPVQVVLDGVYVGTFTSNGSGQINIASLGLSSPPTTSRVGVGIAMDVTLPPPAIVLQSGSLAGVNMSIPSVKLFLVGARGGAVNGSPIHDQALPLPSPTDPVAALDGWRQMSGIETDPETANLTITHTEPYYFEVAAVGAAVDYGS